MTLRGSARALIVVLLTTAGVAVLPGVASAADTTLQVVAVGLGDVRVDPAPKASVRSDGPPEACPSPISVVHGSRTEMQASSCILTYDAGTAVTLTADGGNDGDGPATTFRRWSDERCPGNSSCTLTLGATSESISALFSPQRVSVILADQGKVTSTPDGVTTFLGQQCVSPADGAEDCAGDFDVDLPAPVELKAAGSEPLKWMNSTPDRPVLCDTISSDGTTCSVAPLWPRWGSVGFAGVDPLPAIPPQISVRFHVWKVGSGSGTVRGDLLDCGSDCTADQAFGADQTLQAVPDSGSRFAGWRAACGSDPTCRLAVGPVTSITATFQRTSSSSSSSGPSGPSGTRGLDARIAKLTVRGHGRSRKILFRVEVGTTATVKAVLSRGRRRVASRRWRVGAGSHLLRLRVPARTRAGVYRLRVSISGAGQTEQITRRVRLRR